MKRNAQISFALIFLILGIASAIQYKSMEKNKEVLEVQSKSIQDVQAQLIREKELSENMKKQISEYQQKIENYQKADNVNELVKKELDDANALSGLADVKGKGIVLTVDVNSSSDLLKDIVPDANKPVLLYDNILYLLNELRAAGAEAISINGERIMATTEIRNAGPHIRINNTNYNLPFEIRAIGNPERLENALKIREGIVDILINEGFNTTIKQEDNVEIPKYKGVLRFEYITKA